MTNSKQGSKRTAAVASKGRPAEGPSEGPSATHRQLVSRGFAPGEAANLTAYLHQLPIGEQPWTLRAVNALLFLRTLERAGRFGPTDGLRTDGAEGTEGTEGTEEAA